MVIETAIAWWLEIGSENPLVEWVSRFANGRALAYFPYYMRVAIWYPGRIMLFARYLRCAMVKSCGEDMMVRSSCRVAVGPHWSSLKIGECALQLFAWNVGDGWNFEEVRESLHASGTGFHDDAAGRSFERGTMPWGRPQQLHAESGTARNGFEWLVQLSCFCGTSWRGLVRDVFGFIYI